MAKGWLLVAVVTLFVVGALAKNKAIFNESKNKATFGREMLSQFMLAPDYVNFNHGSYGSTPRVVMDQMRQLQEQMEAKPDVWFRGQYRELMRLVRRRLAPYIGATDADDLVFIENASSGINAIYRGLRFAPGDKLLQLSTEYNMVKNVLQFLADKDGVTIVTVPITFPVTSAASFLDPIREALNANPEIKIVVFSHITSMPAVILPAKEIIELCHSRGIPVVVDGAHALGHIPLDMTDLNAEYYLANGHKWLFSPKGSAFLWVNKNYQNNTVPTIISNEFKGADYVNRFEYVGTRDYTPMIAIDAAITFWDSLGGEETIMPYNRELAWWAGTYLSKVWNTSLLAPQDMVGAMVDIRMPVSTMAQAQAIQSTLLDRYGMYIILHELDGQPWVRLSAQIFLEQADFILLGDNVQELLRTSKMTGTRE